MLEDNYILENAMEKIKKFDHIGLHYNLVADQVYKMRFRKGTDPFSQSYIRYLIAGLISFDMGRMMGSGKYEIKYEGFARRLYRKITQIQTICEQIIDSKIIQIDLNHHSSAIENVYHILSENGEGALNEDNKDHFYVGATKILHFLNPNLFIIVDSNAAKAFRKTHNVRYRKGTQPGYTKEKYLECMTRVKEDITAFGLEDFKALDPNTPITRIYDKLTFISGQELE